jgi:hypothetical protein
MTAIDELLPPKYYCMVNAPQFLESMQQVRLLLSLLPIRLTSLGRKARTEQRTASSCPVGAPR